MALKKTEKPTGKLVKTGFNRVHFNTSEAFFGLKIKY
jgi:hypothetical protein